MRFHALGIIPTVLFCLTTSPTRAQVIYCAPPTVVYYQACQPVCYAPICYPPRVYYAPPMYGQPPYSHRPYAPAYPARPTTVATVGAYDNYFEPKTINVQPGTTVRWVNKGRHPHTVTAQDDRWDSGDIAPGASYTATFQQLGAYYYYCRHHTADKMQGTIVVGSQEGGSERGATRSGGQRSEGPTGGSRSSGY